MHMCGVLQAKLLDKRLESWLLHDACEGVYLAIPVLLHLLLSSRCLLFENVGLWVQQEIVACLELSINLTHLQRTPKVTIPDSMLPQANTVTDPIQNQQHNKSGSCTVARH